MASFADLADTTILADGCYELPAHSQVLAMHSRVQRALFAAQGRGRRHGELLTRLLTWPVLPVLALVQGDDDHPILLLPCHPRTPSTSPPCTSLPSGPLRTLMVVPAATTSTSATALPAIPSRRWPPACLRFLYHPEEATAANFERLGTSLCPVVRLAHFLDAPSLLHKLDAYMTSAGKCWSSTPCGAVGAWAGPACMGFSGQRIVEAACTWH